MSSTVLPALDPITDQNSLFLLCDIQETFRGKIVNYENLISTSKFLVDVSNVLSIPVLTTEQKPFKPTVKELAEGIDSQKHPKNKTFSKSLFSMLTSEVIAEMSSPANAARRHIVLFGIEAHVCVLQTTLDLLRRGYHVHLVVDAISSQANSDREIAVMRFQAEASRMAADGSGVLQLTSAESLLFEMLADAQHPKFKQLLPFMKELAAVKKAAPAVNASKL